MYIMSLMYYEISHPIQYSIYILKTSDIYYMYISFKIYTYTYIYIGLDLYYIENAFNSNFIYTLLYTTIVCIYRDAYLGVLFRSRNIQNAHTQHMYYKTMYYIVYRYTRILYIRISPYIYKIRVIYACKKS